MMRSQPIRIGKKQEGTVSAYLGDEEQSALAEHRTAPSLEPQKQGYIKLSAVALPAVFVLVCLILIVLVQVLYILSEAQPAQATTKTQLQTKQSESHEGVPQGLAEGGLRKDQVDSAYAKLKEEINETIVSQRPSEGSYLFLKELREAKIRSQMTKRKIYANKAVQKYQQDNQSREGQLNDSKISHQQFLQAIQKTIYTGYTSDQIGKLEIFDKEAEQFQSKYKINEYPELPFCLVVPTYNNIKNYKYFFNAHSLLSQNYTNFRAVFVDDASSDETAQAITLILAEQSQKDIKLVKNKQRRGHMANIYTAVHEFCRPGEILMIVDGDDELIGRNVLKLFNAYYHSTKALSIYSNHLRAIKNAQFFIGTSKPYASELKQNNSFRFVEHNYSHLKTTWVDLFLQIKTESLQDTEGRWFENAVDNAFYFCVLEMSCGEVEYLAELTYKYNMFTGNNVFEQAKKVDRAKNAAQIRQKQPYACIKGTDLSLYSRIKGYMN